jgi:cytochrome d ubiquinol oxidase subunit I
MDIHDPVLLARMQFAANITFHILFPAITISLGWFLLFFKGRFNKTGDRKWMDAYFFWTKIFALCFAIGIVTGVTMSFQFGTNWPGFMLTVGNIAGPLLAYEVLTAFFLEATFLGIMLFGYNRVSPFVHTLATFLVAAGTTLSAFWILALNSWMQTPAGFEMIDGKAYATDWLAIIFNPSMPYRIAHMLLASGLTASFLVAGVSAYRWLRAGAAPDVMAALRTAIVTAAVLVPLQVAVGDLHGLNTREHQPQKIAAMEALWETRKEAPLVLFALPDEKTQTNRYAFELPKMASLILTHAMDGAVQGIKDFPGNHPPVAPVFFAFRIMVGMGLLMLAAAWAGAFLLWRRKDLNRPVARLLALMTFSGWVATVAGWYVTEIGRQPWLVYGVLRVEDAASSVPAPAIGLTLVLYLALYAFLLTAFIGTVTYMAQKASTAPLKPPAAEKEEI